MLHVGISGTAALPPCSIAGRCPWYRRNRAYDGANDRKITSIVSSPPETIPLTAAVVTAPDAGATQGEPVQAAGAVVMQVVRLMRHTTETQDTVVRKYLRTENERTHVSWLR